VDAVMRLGDGEMTLADWLLDPPGPDELDERGCYSDQAIAELESRLLDSVQAELETYDEQAAPVTMVPDDRWALISGLQKAIRFGTGDVAAWTADQLCVVDPDALRRRLGVISCEDVMSGGPLIVAQTLAILGARAWRQEQGEQKVLRWVARKLAEADHDRSAAELLDSALSDPRVAWSELNRMPEAEMLSVVADPSQPFALRSATAWLLSGPKFALGPVPKTPWRSPTRLFRLMVQMGSTRWGCFVAAKVASRVRNPMWVEVPFIDAWMRQGTRTVMPMPDFPRPLIRGLPAAYADMHTRDGLQALRRFAKVPAISRILAGVQPGMERDAVKLGCFYAEGGCVARRVSWGPESQEVYDFIRLGPEFVRWRRPELASELIPAIRAALPDLNLMRESIVGQAFGADVDESRNEGTR
jgi:hypothetical protein